jgi:hypothetical protein
MTEEQIQQFWEMYPDCPSPEHHPKIFEYYLRLYWYSNINR